jgi:hypothetical protein
LRKVGIINRIKPATPAAICELLAVSTADTLKVEFGVFLWLCIFSVWALTDPSAGH